MAGGRWPWPWPVVGGLAGWPGRGRGSGRWPVAGGRAIGRGRGNPAVAVAGGRWPCPWPGRGRGRGGRQLKKAIVYYSVLQSTTPVLLCTTKYYSGTTPCTTKYAFARREAPTSPNAAPATQGDSHD